MTSQTHFQGECVVLRDRKLNIAPAIKKQVSVREMETISMPEYFAKNTNSNAIRCCYLWTFTVDMRNQRGRLLCSHSGQSDEQYSARSIRHCLSAWYVCFVGNVVGLPLCAFVAYFSNSNAIAMSIMGLGMFLICFVVLRYSPFRFIAGASGVPAIYPQTIPYQPFYQYYSVPMVSFHLGSMYFPYCVTYLVFFFYFIWCTCNITINRTTLNDNIPVWFYLVRCSELVPECSGHLAAELSR